MLDRKIKRFYGKCINETRLEERGVRPLLDTLKSVGGWPILENDKDYSDFRWYDQLYKLNEEGFAIDTILDHSVGIDSKNNSWRVIVIDQPDFGLSKEYLVNGTDHKLVKEYFRYMVNTAILLGADPENIETELQLALDFEVSLAKISATKEERRDANKKYNPTTVGEMTNEDELVHPKSWETHFQLIFDDALEFGSDEEEKNVDITKIQITSAEKMIIKDLYFFGNLTELIKNTEPRVIANYMAWRVVKSLMNNLNNAARDLKEAFDRAVRGTQRRPAAWKRCARKSGFNSYTDYKLAAGASSMYVRKHFSLEEKKSLNTMFSYIQDSFQNTLRNTNWMDKETKENAIKKMEKMDQVIAYPDELLNKDELDEYYKGK